MTYRNIEIFLSICENGNSITKAAEALFISQPTVTMNLRDMEKELGVLLFDRIGRKLYLTDAGRKFKDYALRIHGLQTDMEKTFRSWDREETIFIGASMTVGSCYLSEYMKAFRQICPDVRTRTIVAPSSNLEQMILKNRIDFAVVEMPMHSPAVRFDSYMEKDLVVLAPPSFEKENISLSEFVRQPLVLRNTGSGTREIFDAVMSGKNIRVEPMMESVSAMALLDAVRNGLGFSVLPEGIAEPLVRRGEAKIISVRGLHFPQTYYLAYHKDKVLSDNMKKFMECVTTNAPIRTADR